MPHRPSPRPQSRRSQAPTSADCRPARCRPPRRRCRRAPAPSSCIPGLCPTNISRCGSCADASRTASSNLRRIGAVELGNMLHMRLRHEVLHRRPGDFPGLQRPDRGRNQHGIGKRRMACDPAADFGGVTPAAVVEPAVLIAAAWRVVLGLGVTQQHQTAHGAFSICSKSSRIMHKPTLCRGGRKFCSPSLPVRQENF